MKIRYHGVRRKGTTNPRKIWVPSETLEVPDDVAEELLRDPEFKTVKQKRRRNKKQTLKPDPKKTPELPDKENEEE